MAVGNPYPPLNVYFSFVSYAFSGDIRYGYLAAILLAGSAHGHSRARPSSPWWLHIFSCFLRGFSSWSSKAGRNPWCCLLAVAVVWCAFHRPAWRFVVLGLLMASKQYMIFLFPLIILLIPPKSSRRFWAQAGGSTVGVAFAVTAPLAFWNFPRFLLGCWPGPVVPGLPHGCIELCGLVCAHVFGQIPPQFLSFIVLAVVLILMMRFAARYAGRLCHRHGALPGVVLCFQQTSLLQLLFSRGGIIMLCPGGLASLGTFRPKGSG